MKRCPKCGREYDLSMGFCLDDGAELLYGPASGDEPQTAILPDAGPTSESPTRTLGAEETGTKIFRNGQAGEPGTKPASRKGTVIAGIVGVFVVAALGIGGYFYYGGGETNRMESIAVLPFENEANDSDTEYLSEGVAESIIYELSKIDELKVSPRSSVIRYKGKGADVIWVGKELNVDAVLSGRIVQRGEDLTISVELVDVRNDRTIWGEQYRRNISDLLKTQAEITDAITSKLRLKLVDKHGSGNSGSYTQNNEAYRNYLRGQYYLNKRTPEGLKNSAESFRKAIEIDPGFALAYVGLSFSLATNAAYSYLPLEEVAGPAKAAALKALELDPDLAEAHIASGLVISFIDWDWKGSEAEFKKALELNPDLADAHFFYGMFALRLAGRYKEAAAELEKALEIEPMSIPIGANLARMYYYAGDYEKALDQGLKVYALDKEHPTTLYWLGRIYNYLGKYSEAKSICSGPEVKQSIGCDSIVSYALAKEGDIKQAREFLENRKNVGSDAGGDFSRAVVYIALGENQLALDELEKSFNVRASSIVNVVADPIYAPLRDEPRFKTLIKKLDLPR